MSAAILKGIYHMMLMTQEGVPASVLSQVAAMMEPEDVAYVEKLVQNQRPPVGRV